MSKKKTSDTFNNPKVDKAWSEANELLHAFEERRPEDRHWNEIWLGTPEGSDEEVMLVEAARALQLAVSWMKFAYKLAKERGSLVY